jgi:hypothetical protein
MNTEELPLLSELIDDLDNGKFEGMETGWVRCYITESDRVSGEKFALVMPIKQLKNYSKLLKDISDSKFALLAASLKTQK